VFLVPNDSVIATQALADGVPPAWIEAARRSPVYRMAVDWRVALPLHPEYRTLPMVWYVPPLSPISTAANAGEIRLRGGLPDVASLRIPVAYLANLFTAGDEVPVIRSLERMLAMRTFMRDRNVNGVENTGVLEQVGLDVLEVEAMHRLMAIANYEDRFVVPSGHREYADKTFEMQGEEGFAFGGGGNERARAANLFGGAMSSRSGRRIIPIKAAR
jgi:nitrate reductase / nitrite oxidoreductase, beta subunit